MFEAVFRGFTLSVLPAPDEFIQHEGCEAFEKRLEEAENSVLYEIRMKERDFDLADPQGKSDFLHEAVQQASVLI